MKRRIIVSIAYIVVFFVLNQIANLVTGQKDMYFDLFGSIMVGLGVFMGYKHGEDDAWPETARICDGLIMLNAEVIERVLEEEGEQGVKNLIDEMKAFAKAVEAGEEEQ